MCKIHKSKIMLEYPNWAFPGPPQKVQVHGLPSPKITKFSKCQTGPPLKFYLYMFQIDSLAENFCLLDYGHTVVDKKEEILKAHPNS